MPEVTRRWVHPQRKNFSGADFTKANLQNINFKKAFLKGANFTKADLRGANFKKAFLKGANFKDATTGLSPSGTKTAMLVALLLSICAAVIAALAGGIAGGSFQWPQLIHHSTIKVFLLMFSMQAALTFYYGLRITASVVFVTLIIPATGAWIWIWYGASYSEDVAVILGLAWAAAGVTFQVWASAVCGAMMSAVSQTSMRMTAGTAATTVIVLLAAIVCVEMVRDLPGEGVVGAMLIVTWGALLGSYIGYRSLMGDPKHASIRKLAIDFSAQGGTSFRFANLTEADFSEAYLRNTDFTGAHLTRTRWLAAKELDYVRPGETYLHNPQLRRLLSTNEGEKENLENQLMTGLNLCGANLIKANLIGVELFDSNLSKAQLMGADLRRARFVKTNLSGANLSGCQVYGISAWDVDLQGATQTDLNINPNPKHDSPMTVDDLEVAQFIYLLLSNQRIRKVIDIITSKVVLILGRFTTEHKVVLDTLRDELRKRNYVPVLFDFDKPANRDFTETVTTLARMSRFIIADLSAPHSVPQELYAIVPDLRSVPIQFLLKRTASLYPMVRDLLAYDWVLKDICIYDNPQHLLASLQEKIISPAEQKAKELEEKRKSAEERAQQLEERLAALKNENAK